MIGSRTLVDQLSQQLRLPLFVAPMFLISGPDLVIAAGKAGVIGAFPSANARSIDDLSAWLSRITGELSAAGRAGMWAINMIVHPTYSRFEAELDLICAHKPRIVVTALGSPKRPLERVHAYGGAVFSDVVNPEQARKAIDAGADGLIAIASGAGGHTGQYSPFALIGEIRRFWDGPLILGGAIGSASAICAAQMMGADFAYMGTRFIAAPEAMVTDDNRDMLVRAGMEDIVTTMAVTGIPSNWMRESLYRAGFTAETLEIRKKIDFSNLQDMKAWKHIWGAGHAIGTTRKVQPVAEIIEDLVDDYRHLAARQSDLTQWPRNLSPHTGESGS